jgi:hypothetical protein
MTAHCVGASIDRLASALIRHQHELPNNAFVIAGILTRACKMFVIDAALGVSTNYRLVHWQSP